MNYIFRNALTFGFLISVLLGFHGCSSIGSKQVASSYFQALEAIQGAVFGYPDVEISKELVEKIPYASAKLRLGKGSAGLIILETIKDKESIWVSADEIYIVLREGRIIRTSGLSNNLIEYKTINQNFEDILKEPDSIFEYFTYLSYDKPSLIDLKVSSSIDIIGLQRVIILGETKDLMLIEETLENEQINWKVTNQFWVDPADYYVWKSIQSISPKLPRFQLEITKKPAD